MGQHLLTEHIKRVPLWLKREVVRSCVCTVHVCYNILKLCPCDVVATKSPHTF